MTMASFIDTSLQACRYARYYCMELLVIRIHLGDTVLKSITNWATYQDLKADYTRHTDWLNLNLWRI